jgi:hypothetical protein
VAGGISRARCFHGRKREYSFAFVQCKRSYRFFPLLLGYWGGANVLEAVRLLLRNPQSISPQNSAGNTPLHWACLNNHVDTAKLLVQEGADMLVKNQAGRDAIWEAEQRGNEELVGWLLGFGDEKAVGEIMEEEGEENLGEPNEGNVDEEGMKADGLGEGKDSTESKVNGFDKHGDSKSSEIPLP